MSVHGDRVRAWIEWANDAASTFGNSDTTEVLDALDALERENKRLEAKLGVALTILEENDPDGDLVLRYFDLTTDEALAKEES